MDSLLKQFAQTSQLGANGAFIEDLYEQYLVAPDSVDGKWKQYFDGLHGRDSVKRVSSPYVFIDWKKSALFFD